jgi:hypothetical protein
MLSNDTTFLKKYHYFLVVPKMCPNCHDIFGFNFIDFQWQNDSIFNNSCTKCTWFVTNWLSCQSKLHLICDKTKFHVKVRLEMKLRRWCNIDFTNEVCHLGKIVRVVWFPWLGMMMMMSWEFWPNGRLMPWLVVIQ